MSTPNPHIRPPHLVFLDDEELLLGVTRRLLRQRHPSWQVMTTTDPVVAIGMVTTTAIDVMVSDLWMPAMNGIDVLTQVAVLRPSTTRILLTGGSGPDPAVMPPGAFHYRLDKPCDHQQLIAVIERALAHPAMSAPS